MKRFLSRIDYYIPKSLEDVLLFSGMFSFIIFVVIFLYILYLALTMIAIPIFENPQVGLIEKELLFIIIILILKPISTSKEK